MIVRFKALWHAFGLIFLGKLGGVWRTDIEWVCGSEALDGIHVVPPGLNAWAELPLERVPVAGLTVIDGGKE